MIGVQIKICQANGVKKPALIHQILILKMLKFADLYNLVLNVSNAFFVKMDNILLKLILQL